jgi:hypothetical protein
MLDRRERERDMRTSIGRSVAGWVAALIAIGVVTACGSSSSTAGGTSTKAQYVARANAVCRDLNKSLKSVGENASSIKVKVGQANQAREQANAKLRAIPMPAPATIPSEWLHFRETALLAVKKIPKAKPRSQESRAASLAYIKATEKAGALAKAYGLVACSTGFAAG